MERFFKYAGWVEPQGRNAVKQMAEAGTAPDAEEEGLLLIDQDSCEEQNIPEDADCSDDRIPHDITDEEGNREIYAADLITATKVLFSGNKGKMYLFLNNWLRNGWLNDLAGSKVLNRSINHDVCDFPHVDYWRIDRENFYADVKVSLQMQTESGEKTWEGYLVCWCCFEENPAFLESPDRNGKKKPRYKFICSIEDLTESVDRPESGYIPLNNHLAPVLSNDRVEEIANGLWERHCKEALTDPGKRDGKMLAEKLGLSVRFCPVYEHRNVESMVFFKEDELYVGEDRIERNGSDKVRHIKAPKGEKIIIPANTIVVNTNKINREFSGFSIFHECFHFEEHYLFYCLQEMACNDRRRIPVKKIILEKGKEYKDTLYFMENQANRGGIALMLPADHTRNLIWEECGKVKDAAHSGEIYETAGEAMHRKLGIPKFRIRQRMIQLGNVRARGAMNKANRREIAPFAFDPDSWRDSSHTFIIDRAKMKRLTEKSAELRWLLDSGKYIYADGHVVKNKPEYVRWDDNSEEYLLTDWAYAHLDQCCLRFIRRYVQRNTGNYVYGRLYYDADYREQNSFFLHDIINERQVDELDAREIYIGLFPKDFKEAVTMLKKQRKISNAKLAEIWNMDDSTFARVLDDRRRYRNEDFLTLLCLCFKLPDWISRLLFKRAGFQLDDDIKRHRALMEILRSQSNDGIDAANRFLKDRGLEPLSFLV